MLHKHYTAKTEDMIAGIVGVPFTFKGLAYTFGLNVLKFSSSIYKKQKKYLAEQFWYFKHLQFDSLYVCK